MNLWIEERAEACRLALGVAGYPRAADTWRLLEWLAGAVSVVTSEDAYCLHLPDGSGIIGLPSTDDRLGEQALHELAHYLCGAGLAAYLRPHSEESPRLARLSRMADAKEEALCAEFVLAWLLPGRLLSDGSAEEESQVELALIARRRERLRGRYVLLTAPPVWSASQTLALTREDPPAVLRLRGTRVEYAVPLGALDADAVTLQVQADLIALTDAEFAAKYRHHRVRERHVLPDISALYQRAVLG